MLTFAESFRNKGPNIEEKAPAIKKARTLEEMQAQNPLQFVPYTKLVKEMTVLSGQIRAFLEGLAIENVELRRSIGAGSGASAKQLEGLVALDADTAAYCTLMVGAIKIERKFVGCGVWKKVTKVFEDRTSQGRLLGALMSDPTVFNEGESNTGERKAKIATRSQNLLMKARLAPEEYTLTKGRENDRMRTLFSGTMVLQHLLLHPRYGKAVEIFFGDLIDSLAPRLEDIKSGELLTWKQQEVLVVEE